MTLVAEQLAKWRERHTIRPIGDGLLFCEHDLIRILGRRSRGKTLWRHDPDAIRRIVVEARWFNLSNATLEEAHVVVTLIRKQLTYANGEWRAELQDDLETWEKVVERLEATDGG
jgi:hypothetical protein